MKIGPIMLLILKGGEKGPTSQRTVDVMPYLLERTGVSASPTIQFSLSDFLPRLGFRHQEVIMFTLRTTQTSFGSPYRCFRLERDSSSRKRSFRRIQSSKDDDSSDPPASAGGDTRNQDLLAKIAMLQTQKVRVSNFLEERSAYLTQFAEDANAEFNEIGENALKELDEASARIMDKLDGQMKDLEETAEISMQEIERNEQMLEEFEERIENDRNEGLFFKSLGETKKNKSQKPQEEKKVHQLEAVEKQNAGTELRRNVYFSLMALLAVSIAEAVLATPEIEWKKVAALGLIFIGLVTQVIYEQNISAEASDERNKDV